MRNSSANRLVRISLFAVLSASGSYIIIPLPFSPVPVTLQNFFVVIAGLILNPIDALLSQLLYLMVGFSGIPVFSGGGSGPGFLFGPTGGYLFGFLFAAFTASLIYRRSLCRRPALAIAAAFFLIYLLGVPWLSLSTGIGIKGAFITGMLPFIPGDIIKGVAAAAVIKRIPEDSVLRR